MLIKKLAGVALSLVCLTAIGLGSGEAQAAADPIVFTAGPGTAAPPTALGLLVVKPTPADPRPTGESVSEVGALKFSTPLAHHRIGDGWATWSHGYRGDVYATDGVTLTLPAKTSAFYFYAEPDRFATITIKARTNSGTTSEDLAVDGEGGARFFGFYSRSPYSNYIKSVTISSAERFAIGEFGLNAANLAPYVALGDSYSAGEGNPSYLPGTADKGNACHRSTSAYPWLISQTGQAHWPAGFQACSGSITRDLTAPNHLYPGDGAQFDALTSLTKVVTLTIGGNDVGFDAVLRSCISTNTGLNGFGCSKKKSITDPVAKRIDALRRQTATKAPGGQSISPYTAVLAAVHQKAPSAKIYIAGYPELFGDQKSTFAKDKKAPSDRVCKVNTVARGRFDYADAQWINARAREVNGVIKTAVDQAKKSDRTLQATYVAPSTFEGHGLCDRKARWMYPLVVTPDRADKVEPGSFHPTWIGQRDGYFAAFRAAGLR